MRVFVTGATGFVGPPSSATSSWLSSARRTEVRPPRTSSISSDLIR